MAEQEYEDLCEISLEEQPSEEDVQPQISVFDLANDIFTKGRLIESWVAEKGELPPQWNAYMILRILSEHLDTLFLANEMNKHWQVPDIAQWMFFRNLVVKKKRYGWTKKTRKDEEREPLALLAEYFHCTEKEMRKNIHAIPRDRLMHLLETLDPERYRPKKAKAPRAKRKEK